MKKTLIIILAIMLLTSCSNNKESTSKTQKETENKVSNKQTNIILDDNDKQEIKLSLSKDKTLKDYFGDAANKIKGNIDLTKEGKYEVKFLNSKGKEITKIIIVGKQETKQAKTQSVPKDNTETNQTTKKQENTYNNEIVVESNTSGLDENNPFVQIARELEGKEGGCGIIAGELLTRYAKRNNLEFTGEEISVSYSELQPGDYIKYPYNENLGYGHNAIYLGNGLALHGNMPLNGKRQAVIGSIDIPNLGKPSFSRDLYREKKQEKTEEEKKADLDKKLQERKEKLEKQYEGSDIFNKEMCQKMWNEGDSAVEHLSDEKLAELVNYCVMSGY